MHKKIQPSQTYKTESQLKEEAIQRHTAEASASAAAPKSELQKKRENFWYHYKWHTIVGIIGVFLIVFFVKEMFFNTKSDATIIIVSERFFDDDERSKLMGIIGESAADYNGDGKIVISSDFISLPQAEDESGQGGMSPPDLTGGQGDMANAMKLMAVIAAGADPIYLLDETGYNYIVSKGQNEDGDGTDNVFETFSVPVGQLTSEGVPGFEGMRLYLRNTCSDEAYLVYCRELLEIIDRSWNNEP